jgi:hypothetical protein
MILRGGFLRICNDDDVHTGLPAAGQQPWFPDAASPGDGAIPRSGSFSGEQNDFGPTLKAERERRGVTLGDLSASTKIAVPLLEALERSDFSRWPEGIYRRAFVRAYVEALGLPSQPVVADCLRLFPDSFTSVDSVPERAPIADLPPGAVPLTLTLAPSPRGSRATLRRVAVVATESSAIISAGAALAWAMGLSFISVAGFLALLYYPLRDIGKFRGHIAARWSSGQRQPRFRWRLAGTVLRRESRAVALRRLRPLIAAAHPQQTDGSTTHQPPAPTREAVLRRPFARLRTARPAFKERWIRLLTSTTRVGRSTWRRISRRPKQDGPPPRD